MREVRSGPRLRRGALVALDGLAVWLLAVVFATYAASDPATRLEAGLTDTVVAAMTAWTSTPGAGPFELLAYAGLAIAVLGPAWYWGVRWVLRRPAAARSGVLAGAEGTSVGSPGTAGRRPPDSDPTSDEPRPGSPPVRRSPSADWVHEVFDDAGLRPTPTARATVKPGPGDFYRSSSRSGHPTTDGGWGETTAAPDAPTNGLRAALGVEPVGEDDDSKTAVESEEEAVSDPEPVAEAAAPDEEQHEAQDEPTADDTPAEPADPDPAPDDPLDRLADEVTASRASIEAVAASVGGAATDTETALVAAQLQAVGESYDSIQALREHAPNGVPPLEECVDGLRGDQDRLEAAFRAALADD